MREVVVVHGVMLCYVVFYLACGVTESCLERFMLVERGGTVAHVYIYLDRCMARCCVCVDLCIWWVFRVENL